MRVSRWSGLLFAMLLYVGAGCGSDGGTYTEEPVTPITPGLFIGETRRHEPLSIQVDSIGTVFVSCGRPTYFWTAFDPPQPIAPDGTFSVDLTQGSRAITISGRFSDQDSLSGNISGDPFCAGKLKAHRCTEADDCSDSNGDGVPDRIMPTTTPTPTPTPTPTSTPTFTVPAATHTPCTASVCPTPTTPATPTRTPTAAPTPEESCRNNVIEGDEECDGSDLDENTCYDLCDQEEEGGTLRCTSDCKYDFSGCPDPSTCEALP